jgi:hypothetical protein
MRPVRITGVTGTTPWVPVDTYAGFPGGVWLDGAGAVEFTADNVFDLSITPRFGTITLTSGFGIFSQGTRAVRATGMAPTDVFSVSQQGGVAGS